jgi:phenylpyruvate tautomerase PptA (4-oxalocrotonate tautomerase family)
MPTYVCTGSARQMTASQKAKIATVIGKIHHEETGGPLYFVQVIFRSLETESHYIAGQVATASQLWIRGDIRAGRSEAQKHRIITRLLQEVSAISSTAAENVWVYLNDVPAGNIAEYGRVLPEPDEEQAWFADLPDALRQRLGENK